MERAQVCREAPIHSPESGNSWVSSPSRRLARVERTLLSAAFNSCREKTEWVEIESQWTARRREQEVSFQPCGSIRPPSGPAPAKLGRGTLVSSNDCNGPGHLSLDFGWRSAGVPSTPGFGVMGWRGSPLALAFGGLRCSPLHLVACPTRTGRARLQSCRKLAPGVTKVICFKHFRLILFTSLAIISPHMNRLSD